MCPESYMLELVHAQLLRKRCKHLFVNPLSWFLAFPSVCVWSPELNQPKARLPLQNSLCRPAPSLAEAQRFSNHSENKSLLVTFRQKS